MKIKNQNGFSFMEVIISIFILAVGIVAVLGLVSSVLKTSLSAKNQEIAGFLAQEGVEIARNIRDDNWAKNDPTFKHFPGSSKNNCRVDFNSTKVGDCNNGSKKLKLNNHGFYSHHVGTTTKFQRKIEVQYEDKDGAVDKVAKAVKAKITSMVIWDRTDFPADNKCSIANRCVYVSSLLSIWGKK